MFIRLIADDGKTVLSEAVVERRISEKTKKLFFTAGPISTPAGADGTSHTGYWNGNPKNVAVAEAKAQERTLASLQLVNPALAEQVRKQLNTKK